MSDISGAIDYRELIGALERQQAGGSISQTGVNGSVSDHANLDAQATVVRRVTGALSMPSSGRKEVISATTEEWNSKPNYISVKDIIYVYTDHNVISGESIPGIKVGDGVTYLIDLPFVTGGCEVTQEQIDFWNNKVAIMIDPNDPECVIFYTN